MTPDADRLRRALAEHAPRRSDWFARLGVDAAVLTPAAVLVGLRAGEAGVDVVLTRRVDHLKHHAGQISFPGGRIDAQDLSVEAAALREAHEEIALDPARVTTLGRLPQLPTITGYAVTPVVGLIAEGERLEANPDEVAEVFSVPLAFLLERGNATRSLRQFGGVSLPVYRYEFEGRVIWGATASIIVELNRVLRSLTD